MLLTESPAVKFEIVSTENPVAFLAGEAVRVELLFLLGLQVWPFNASIAIFAKRIVELVVVSGTVGMIVHDIEIGSREGRLAGLTHEALLMVSSSKSTAIFCSHRFASDEFPTTSAVALIRYCRSLLPRRS